MTQGRPINTTVLFKYHKTVRIAKRSEVGYGSGRRESICTHAADDLGASRTARTSLLAMPESK